MPNFMIDAGNSSTGPVGFVLRLDATDRVRALERARAILGDLAPGQAIPVPLPAGLRGEVTYFNVYVNPDALTLADVVEGEARDNN